VAAGFARGSLEGVGWESAGEAEVFQQSLPRAEPFCFGFGFGRFFPGAAVLRLVCFRFPPTPRQGLVC
jgi:hypothetical protein